jgi:transposase-like protein
MPHHLRDHMISKTENSNSKTTKRRFECDVCGQKFFNFKLTSLSDSPIKGIEK